LVAFATQHQRFLKLLRQF